MNRRYPRRGLDFFAVLLILVVIGFGMTLAVQIGAGEREQVVNSDRIEAAIDAG